MYIPDKGDIVKLNFDPSAGREIMKFRPALVISRKAFNEHTGFAIVAPITSTVRGTKIEVLLPQELETQGAVLIYQIKSLGYANRQIQLIEKAPYEVVEKATLLAKTIIN